MQAAKLNKSVLVVEKGRRVGGVSVHTGTIPSKTLRETVLNLSGWRERGFYGRAHRGQIPRFETHSMPVQELRNRSRLKAPVQELRLFRRRNNRNNSGARIIRSVGDGVQPQAGDRAPVSCLVTG